ncbi:SQUALENE MONOOXYGENASE [Salix purpurea]|uniref:Squalene monooxygenase n=1 Tax=Salix purpurea TaxID=77065 RepID=A0A9Q0V8Z0_SALPP|nr:SQUALENE MONOOXYGENASE [Salix purpurea]
MDSKHIFGGVVAAFLFGFVVLYSSRRREKIKSSEKTPTKKNLKSSGNGVCRSNFAGNTDVIIVGAGVAGSALAYALAKTVFSFAAVHKDGKRSAISYPSNASGRGFHHGRFVQKLREKAASLPKYSSFPLQPIGTE